eukprot:3439741-Pleurochrysis_carterae.AAC.1
MIEGWISKHEWRSEKKQNVAEGAMRTCDAEERDGVPRIDRLGHALLRDSEREEEEGGSEAR